MTNGELGSRDLRPAFCSECGWDYGIGVDEDGSVVIFCECTYHDPEEFIEGLEEEMPMEVFDKENSRDSQEDDSASKGFQ